MADQERPSFWSTLPGILTGAAALLTAIVGLLTWMHQPRQSQQNSSAGGQTIRPNDNGQPAFRVVELLLRADPFDYSGKCPVKITFSGRVSVAGSGGTVSYKFLRSDGASAPVATLRFERPGSQDVSTYWMLGGGKQTLQGWQAIETYDPEKKQSSHATFSIRCE